MSYPQFPQAPMPGPGQVAPQSKASGATAIIAGVFAALGALTHLVIVIMQLGVLDMMFDASAVFAVEFFGYLLLAVILGIGAGLLFARKPIGRWLVAGGSAFAIVLFIIVTFWSLSYSADVLNDYNNTYNSYNTYADVENVGGGVMAGVGGVAVLIMCIPAIATLVLALVPPTGKWIRQGKSGAAQGSGGFPAQAQPQLGYGQPYPQQYPPQQYPPQQPPQGYPQQPPW